LKHSDSILVPEFSVHSTSLHELIYSKGNPIVRC